MLGTVSLETKGKKELILLEPRQTHFPISPVVCFFSQIQLDQQDHFHVYKSVDYVYGHSPIFSTFTPHCHAKSVNASLLLLECSTFSFSLK